MKVFNLAEELEKERKKNKELQDRIDKAIEYIKKYEIIDQVDYDIKPVLEEVIKPILKGE